MPIPEHLRTRLEKQLQKVADDLRATAQSVDAVRFPSLAQIAHEYAKTIRQTQLESFLPEMWALLVANGYGLTRIAKDCASLPDASAPFLEVRRTARELRDAWRKVSTIDQTRIEQALQLLDEVAAFAEAWRAYDLATEAGPAD